MKNVALIILATLATQPALAVGDASHGEEIFKTNCAECHLKTDFRGQSVAMIETRMKSTTGIDAMHEAGLTMLSPKDRDDIAAFFAASGKTAEPATEASE